MADANGSNGNAERNGHGPPRREIELAPTSAKAWRKAREEGYVIPLPSGYVARLRPVAIDQLLKGGKIPDILSPVAARSLWQDTYSADISENEDLNADFMGLIDFIVPLAMMTPRVVGEGEEPDPEKEEIRLEDLDFVDKVAIFNLSTQPAELLRSFRDKQVERLRLASHEQDLQPEAKQLP
jgi:hypothetical protein